MLCADNFKINNFWIYLVLLVWFILPPFEIYLFTIYSLSTFVGERRIRVHTMCLPITNQINEVIAGADQRAIISLLAKMGKILSCH